MVRFAKAMVADNLLNFVTQWGTSSVPTVFNPMSELENIHGKSAKLCNKETLTGRCIIPAYKKYIITCIKIIYF